MQIEFKAWPKIPRWDNEKYTITEKIDGSNGCIIITEDGDIFAQSRSRILDETSAGDNFGFCKWVRGNKDELLKLGCGYHYGEWWGSGIQRGYGLTEKRFSLFNVWHETLPDCVSMVPVIASTYEGAWERLLKGGSVAAPGFMNPEGFVMLASQNRGVRYKVLFD